MKARALLLKFDVPLRFGWTRSSNLVRPSNRQEAQRDRPKIPVLGSGRLCWGIRTTNTLAVMQEKFKDEANVAETVWRASPVVPSFHFVANAR